MKKLIINLLMVATILTARKGVNYYGDQKETWYNLPMERVLERADKNFGKHHKRWIRDDGVRMYGTYIILAGAKERYGEVVETSLGTGIILDSGAFAIDNPKAVDIAVTWK